MNYRPLGRSGLRVSPLCLGAMTFGEADAASMMHEVGASEAESHRILDAALAAGINFVDTADVYGQDGLSERVIGNWFEQTGRRDEVVLATKFRFKMHDRPMGSGGSRRRIVEACEASLRRLKTDHIDLYQIHMQDVDTPEEETLRALDDLVRQGKVLYLGASNYAAYRLVHSLWISQSSQLERFVGLQMQYSLMVRDLEREHVPLAQQWGLGILPWSPLAGGFLTGKYRRGDAAPDGTRLGRWKRWLQGFDNDRGWAVVDALREVAEELGATPAQTALAWLLTRPGVTSPIFGVRSVEQLEQILPAVELKLSDAQVARLEQASRFELGYPYEFMQRIQGRW